jgi:hypothetical protein
MAKVIIPGRPPITPRRTTQALADLTLSSPVTRYTFKIDQSQPAINIEHIESDRQRLVS